MLRTLEFLPAMPPSTVSGNVMSAQMTRMMHMVPKGSAAVDCTWCKACQHWFWRLYTQSTAFMEQPLPLRIKCSNTLPWLAGSLMSKGEAVAHPVDDGHRVQE